MFGKEYATAQLVKFTDTNQTGVKIRNLHLLPFYYFLPEDIIKAHSKRFQSLPRNPHMILQDTELIEYIESPEFAVEIGDIVSAGVWYYLDIHCGSGVYSEFDPIWLLTYHIDWYLSALTKALYLCQVQVLFQIFDRDIPYTPWELYHIALIEIVPVVVREHNLQPIIDCVKENRCFEDYQPGRDSKQWRNFVRQWYHSRTQHPQVLMTDLCGGYNKKEGEYNQDFADPRSDFQNEINSNIDAEEFMKALTEKDRRILEMRIKNYTYEEIAAKLGYKTHSAVIKRIKRIGAAYQKYAKTDLGFD